MASSDCFNGVRRCRAHSWPLSQLIDQSESHFPGELPPCTLVADAMRDMDGDALRHSVEKIFPAGRDGQYRWHAGDIEGGAHPVRRQEQPDPKR
jgi:hypothetical protein